MKYKEIIHQSYEDSSFTGPTERGNETEAHKASNVNIFIISQSIYVPFRFCQIICKF
jgi:hypothetical protein